MQLTGDFVRSARSDRIRQSGSRVWPYIFHPERVPRFFLTSLSVPSHATKPYIPFLLSSSFFLCTFTMSSSNKKGLVAFPSVSSSLNSLPRATSMSNVSLHPNMYAQRAKESEAKVCSPSFIARYLLKGVFISSFSMLSPNPY